MSYDEVNDYELLSIVADNEDATEILFKKYRPLIVGIARKFYSSIKNNGCDFNDFVQEAMIAFSMAINTFDEKKDALFFTYAKTCIERRLSTLLRTFNRAKNQLLNELNPSSPIYLALSTTLLAPPETRGSILSVFQQKILPFISKENLSSLLSKSDMSLKDEINGIGSPVYYPSRWEREAYCLTIIGAKLWKKNVICRPTRGESGNLNCFHV